MRRSVVILLALFLSACTRQEKLDLGRLRLPPGFHIGIFAEVRSARMMAFSPGGVLLVTATNEGAVVALPDANAAVERKRRYRYSTI